MNNCFLGHLKSDAHRAFSSFAFWCAVLLICAVQILSSYEEISGCIELPMHPLHFFQYSLALCDIQFLAPTISGSAFALAFLQDWQNRFHRALLLRGSINSYILSRYLIALFVGACAMAVAMMMFAVILTFTSGTSWTDAAAMVSGNLMPTESFSSLIKDSRPFAYVICVTANRALLSMAWTGVAVAVSAWISNRFFVLLVPLMFSYAEQDLMRFIGLKSLKNIERTLVYGWDVPHVAGLNALLYTLPFVLLGFFAFYKGVKRRLELHG